MDAWRSLGVPLEGVTTAEEALKQGLLGDWNVRKTPLYAALPEDKHGVSRTVEVLERVAVVRDNPVVAGQVDHIGIVSPSYKIVANEEQTDLLNALADEAGATFPVVGELEGGRKVFVVLQLPGQLLVNGDQVVCCIAMVKSHDGTTPFMLLVTPIHVATGTVLASHQLVRIRHTSGAGPAIYRQARTALDGAFDYLDDFHAVAKKLAATPMSLPKFEAVVEAEYGPTDSMSAAATTRAERKVAEITALFDENQETAWAGFVALARWFDHHSPTRGDERETSRSTKAVLDAKFKDDALRLMKKVL